MKNRFFKNSKFCILIFTFLLSVLILSGGCEDVFSLRKELEIELLSFPPKLSVTAILNGASGIFDIRIMEGLSLADTYVKFKENTRNGEIRLYEDGKIILSIPGPFDMSREITESYITINYGRNGYRYVSGGINAKAGSVYRLEVDVEGYPSVVSSSVMPIAPVVSASMDTSRQFVKKNIREFGIVGYYTSWWDDYPERYWTLSVNADAPENKLFLIDILKNERIENIIRRGLFWGIGGSDASMLMENGINNGLINNQNTELYLFSLLMAKDFKGASRIFYAAVDESAKRQNNNAVHFEDDPDYEKITIEHSLILRVRNITPATYSFFNSLSMQLQFAENRFKEQPVTVVGNIEGGYGSFSVYNATYISLLDWETYEYRKKE